jgi:type IV pilus assembly protein PilQ
MKGYRILSITLLAFFTLASAQDKTTWDQVVIEKLEMRNAPVGDVLRLIASRYQLNIFVDPNLDQKVSINLQNATLQDIIDYLGREYRIQFKIDGNIISVSPPKPVMPGFKIDYSQADSTLSMAIENASLTTVLDSLTLITGVNFIYKGKSANNRQRFFLQKARFPDDVLVYLYEMGFNTTLSGNLFVVKDMDPKSDKNAPGFSRGQQKKRREFVFSPDGHITIDINNYPIEKIIRETAEELNNNIVLYDLPKGNITLHAENLSFDQMLELVLNGTNFTYRKNDDIYIIGDSKISGIQTSRIIPLDHMKVEGITKMLPKYLTRNAELSEIKEHNSLSVVALPSVINDIENYLDKIDREIPQVLIEAVVVDFDVSDQLEFGLSGGLSDQPIADSSGVYQMLPGLDILFKGKVRNDMLDAANDFFGKTANIGKLPQNFFLQLKALEDAGKANVKSKPHIATLNGHEASIDLSVTQYYKLKTSNYYNPGYNNYQSGSSTNQQGTVGNTFYPPSETERFEQIEAKVSLKITPWISGDNEITVEVNPVFQTPLKQFSPDTPPTIQSREIKSTVRLKDGETIILGGLIEEKEEENRSQVPLLGDIPLLGYLFRNSTTINTKKELIIYVTPHLHQSPKTGIDAYTNIRFKD